MNELRATSASLSAQRDNAADNQWNKEEIRRLLSATPDGVHLSESLRHELEQPDIGEGLRLLVAAEIHRRNGQVLECCEALGAVCAKYLLETQELAKLKSDIVAACVAYAQRTFGAGEQAKAIAINRTLLRVAPETQEPLTELLLVHLFVRVDLTACEEFAIQANTLPVLNERLTVLLAEYYYRIGDQANVARLLASVATVEFHDPNYSAWHARMKLRAAAHLYGQRHSVDNMTRAVAAAQLSGAFADYLRTIADPDEQEVAVIRLAYFNDYKIQNSHEIISKTIILMSEYGSDDMAGTGAAYFNAMRDHDGFRRLLKIAEHRPSLWSNPNFAKSASRYAQATDNLLLDKTISGAADSIIAAAAGSRSAKAMLRANEIKSRAIATSVRGQMLTDVRLPSLPIEATRLRYNPWRTRHLFIGLFGQLRHVAETLPRLRSFIETEVAKLSRSVKVHFGMAVWDETGQRPIVSPDGNHGGVDVLFDRLPRAITELCHRYDQASIDGFSHAFPSTFKLAVDLSRQISKVDRQLIEQYFGLVDQLDINEKGPFQVEIERLVSLTFADSGAPSPDWRNQLMMWERIGKFRAQIEQQEKLVRAQIYGGAFIRVDLMLGEEASIKDVLNSIIEGQKDQCVWVDHDPVAAFFEGVGDRYFIGGRRGLLTVSSLWSCIQSLADLSSGPHSIYRKRLLSHTLIGCFLFEQGISVRGIGQEKVPFRIHRGSLSLDVLRASLEADLASMDMPVHRDMAALLNLADDQRAK